MKNINIKYLENKLYILVYNNYYAIVTRTSLSDKYNKIKVNFLLIKKASRTMVSSYTINLHFIFVFNSFMIYNFRSKLAYIHLLILKTILFCLLLLFAVPRTTCIWSGILFFFILIYFIDWNSVSICFIASRVPQVTHVGGFPLAAKYSSVSFVN